jgi:hypothetical protein
VSWPWQKVMAVLVAAGRSRFGRPLGLPISGPGLTIGVGRLSTEVNMAVEAIEREMDGTTFA